MGRKVECATGRRKVLFGSKARHDESCDCWASRSVVVLRYIHKTFQRIKIPNNFKIQFNEKFLLVWEL